jgi:hypothetical protein
VESVTIACGTKHPDHPSYQIVNKMAFSISSKPAACFAAGQRRPARVSRARTVSPQAALELKPLPYETDAFEPLLSKER